MSCRAWIYAGIGGGVVGPWTFLGMLHKSDRMKTCAEANGQKGPRMSFRAFSVLKFKTPPVMKYTSWNGQLSRNPSSTSRLSSLSTEQKASVFTLTLQSLLRIWPTQADMWQKRPNMVFSTNIESALQSAQCQFEGKQTQEEKYPKLFF